MDKEGKTGQLQYGCIHNKVWRKNRLMDKKTDKDKKLDELMKELQQEQMRLHPELYETPKKETDN